MIDVTKNSNILQIFKREVLFLFEIDEPVSFAEWKVFGEINTKQRDIIITRIRFSFILFFLNKNLFVNLFRKWLFQTAYNLCAFFHLFVRPNGDAGQNNQQSTCQTNVKVWKNIAVYCIQIRKTIQTWQLNLKLFNQLFSSYS